MSFPYTVQDFLDAYQATGLTPVRFCTLDRSRHCGCPLGVLALHKFGEKAYMSERDNYAELRRVSKLLSLDVVQAHEFAETFDCGHRPSFMGPSPAAEMAIKLRGTLGNVWHSSNYHPW